MRYGLREHTNSVKDWTEDNWNLFDVGISSKKHLILLGPFFNEFLIFVELLKVIHSGDINSQVVSSYLIGVFLIGDNADLHFWTRNVWKSN